MSRRLCLLLLRNVFWATSTYRSSCGTHVPPGVRGNGTSSPHASRSLEDAGTLTSVLIPWNTCGAYNSGVLGVPTVEYLPYAFLNYLNPLMAILLTYMGIGTAWKGKEGEPVIAREKPAGL